MNGQTSLDVEGGGESPTSDAAATVPLHGVSDKVESAPSTYPSRLYDGRPPAEHVETSRAAADSISTHANTMRALVKRLIRETPTGCTDDEIEARLGLRHQSASARRRELVLLGEIVDSGERRATRSGRKAAVWKVAS